MPHRVAAAIAMLSSVLACAQAAAPKADDNKLQAKSRVYLIRGILAEMAVARKTLPRGKDGLRITSDGQIDENALKIALANIGPAVRPGEVAQITKMEFRKDAIVLEINGGTGQKKKWWEHIELSGPVSSSSTQDQQAEQRAGGIIVLDFRRAVPDITVEEFKTMLAPLLDFSQRSASLVFSDTWPPEIQEAVKNHEITAGMSKDQVLASRGRPENKIRERKGHADQETWMYGIVPDKITMVIFEQDEVVEARMFIPGIPATKVPREGDPPETAPTVSATPAPTTPAKPQQP